MNRTELLARLRDASIDPRSYDVAEGRWENYVLHESDGRWEVFYFERGIKRGLRTFEHEAEANVYFFDLVVDDPTTRLT